MNKIKSQWLIFIFLIIFVLVPLIFPIGIRVATDFPYSSSELLKTGFKLPQTWINSSAEGMGEYGVPTLWSWPFSFTFGILSQLGFGFQFIEYVTLIIPIFLLGVISINKFLSYFGIGKSGRVVGGLLYLTSTYFLLLIDGGQLSIALEYAFFPYVFLLIINSLNKGLRAKVLASLGVCIMGILEPRILFILCLLVTSYVFYLAKNTKMKLRFSFFKSAFLSAFVIIVLFISLNFYWIFPMIMAKSEVIPLGYVAKTLSFVTFKNAITLYQPQWPLNVFGVVTRVPLEILLIPMLILISLIFYRKYKNVSFWLGTFVISAFMAKGVNPPFGEIYQWLFDNLPGFFLFRDSTKFFLLVCLSASYLFGFVSEKLLNFFKWRIIVGNLKVSLLGMLFVVYLVFLIRPIYLGEMTGMFSLQQYEKYYLNLHSFFQNDLEFGRVLWLPYRNPLSFSSPNHLAIEGLRFLRERPIATGVVGNYELFNFIREAAYVGEIFDIAGIKYISYPYPDERRYKLKDEEKIYYNAFADQIEHVAWVKQKLSGFPINVFQTKANQDRFFIADNLFYVVGSDELYLDLIKTPNFKLSKNALVFVQELTDFLGNVPEYGRILLYNSSSIDFQTTLFDKTKFIFPAKNLANQPGDNGWWKRDMSDIVWWRDFLHTKYNLDNQDFDYKSGFAIAEGEKELSIGLGGDGNLLLARTLESVRGGEIEFWQSGKLIGRVITKNTSKGKRELTLAGYKDVADQKFYYDRADFKWLEVGKLIDDSPIKIKTKGDFNAINALLVVPEGKWEGTRMIVDKLRKENRVIDWSKISEKEKLNLLKSHNNSKISYTTLSPTHYRVKIEGLTGRASVIFSEAFNTNWFFGNKKSTKIYSLVNGFAVEKDGEYDVYFEPQKYILPGLAVSFSVLGAISGYLLYNFVSDKKSSKLRPIPKGK